MNNKCNDCAPCNDPCQEPAVSPCYQDCGCINPTTWECITKPGIISSLGITNDMNGLEVLNAIGIIIDNLVIGIPPSGDDKFAKVSSTDTTTDYLDSKLLVQSPITKTIINASANEKLRFGFNIPAIVSADAGNLIEIGTDGKLRALPTDAPADISLIPGTGIIITGTGPSTDPFVISTNPTIQVARTCFDNTWRNITLVSSGNANVVYTAGTPQYRYRYDGTIEFKGSVTYTVAFGAYTSGTRKYTIPLGNIPTTCLSAGEQNGVADLKGITYIDIPQAGDDQYTQQYGYIIRKNSQNLILEFQSSFISATSKTIVVNFEGAVSYPNI